MQPTNNNPVTEIILGVLSALFIAGGVLLLYVGKTDFAGAAFMFGLPAVLLGINGALKAPSPAQQAALLSLTAQALQTQAQPQLAQAPAPAATPQAVQMPFTPASSAAATPFAPAMLTTQTGLPTVQPGQPQ
jgi:hypothetical protein